MKNYILVAEEQEKKLIVDILGGKEVANNQFELLDKSLWQLLITGVGAINVIQTLQTLPKDGHYINIGYAGSANFEIGTIVAVTQSHLNHPNANYEEPVFTLKQPTFPLSKPFIQAPCYTHTDFVLQSDYADCIFDMELAFIMALGFENVVSIKHVSDNLSKKEYINSVKS